MRHPMAAHLSRGSCASSYNGDSCVRLKQHTHTPFVPVHDSVAADVDVVAVVVVDVVADVGVVVFIVVVVVVVGLFPL